MMMMGALGGAGFWMLVAAVFVSGWRIELVITAFLFFLAAVIWYGAREATKPKSDDDEQQWRVGDIIRKDGVIFRVQSVHHVRGENSRPDRLEIRAQAVSRDS